jgi:hypothetical protein
MVCGLYDCCPGCVAETAAGQRAMAAAVLHRADRKKRRRKLAKHAPEAIARLRRDVTALATTVAQQGRDLDEMTAAIVALEGRR